MANPLDYYTKGMIVPEIDAVTAERTVTFPDRDINLGRIDEFGYMLPDASAVTMPRELKLPDSDVDLGVVPQLTYDTGWIDVTTFSNGWEHFDPAGTVWPRAGYRRDALGRVHLRGLIKSGSVGVAAFTLPVGYRPSRTAMFATVSNAAFGIVIVDATGTVRPAVPSSNVYVALFNVSFFPD